MRISTSGMHRSALEGILERNAELVKTQQQVSTGKRILTPADDPSGSVRALDIDRALSESNQFSRNIDTATNRLSYEEQTLSDMTTLLQRVRDLTLQGANASVDANGRQAIAQELEDRFNDLLDMANRKDANGEYLFSGYATLTQPFAKSGSSVTYSGDQGTRLVQTSPTQKIPDGHPGSEVFQNVLEGNGTFVTGANVANTGTGVIDAGTVSNPAAWVQGDYTVVFTSATTYDILDSTNATVASGNYTSGNAIALNGAQFTIKGDPATGDRFSVNTSRTEDMFTTLRSLITSMKRGNFTPTERALFNTEMGTSVQQLDRALDHTNSVRSDVGARLSVLDQTTATREERESDLTQSLSQIRDLDYADAVTRLNVQLAGLQAAQASYTKVGQLSLFDYFR